MLCTAVGSRSPKPGVDFFPLTVNYQKRHLLRAKSLVAFSSVKGALLKRNFNIPVN